jgi:hypothetical protein
MHLGRVLCAGAAAWCLLTVERTLDHRTRALHHVRVNHHRAHVLVTQQELDGRTSSSNFGFCMQDPGKAKAAFPGTIFPSPPVQPIVYKTLPACQRFH